MSGSAGSSCPDERAFSVSSGLLEPLGVSKLLLLARVDEGAGEVRVRDDVPGRDACPACAAVLGEGACGERIASP